MTQPPYVPPSGDDNPTRSNPGWPPSQDLPAGEQADAELFASQFPDPAVAGTASAEPSPGVYTGQNVYPGQEQSTKDVAKGQAAEVKDTAVEKGQQVAGVAKEQAAEVKDTAVEKGQQVAGVAKEQATKVASEAGQQVKQLLTEGRSELTAQAGTQQQRLASGLHALAGELGSMASKSDQSGPLTDFAQQASQKGGEIAHWLENHEPSELLEEVKSFARRRPAAFLAVAALAGVVAGRLTRGLTAAAKSESTAPASPVSGRLGTSTVPPRRENISMQEIPTSGTGAGPTTDRPDYEWVDDTASSFGTTGRGDVVR